MKGGLGGEGKAGAKEKGKGKREKGKGKREKGKGKGMEECR